MKTPLQRAAFPGLSGLRILVLSDVHTNLPLLEKAAAMAEQARPDMIVFLGDLYTDFLRATHAGDYITQMKRLSSIARPTRAWATMTWPWWTTWSAF